MVGEYEKVDEAGKQEGELPFLKREFSNTQGGLC